MWHSSPRTSILSGMLRACKLDIASMVEGELSETHWDDSICEFIIAWALPWPRDHPKNSPSTTPSQLPPLSQTRCISFLALFTWHMPQPSTASNLFSKIARSASVCASQPAVNMAKSKQLSALEPRLTLLRFSMTFATQSCMSGCECGKLSTRRETWIIPAQCEASFVAKISAISRSLMSR